MEKILDLKNEKVLSFYNQSLSHFRKQFTDVVSITKLYVNKDSKVYAGEWIDSKGNICFNSGYAPDVVKILIFK